MKTGTRPHLARIAAGLATLLLLSGAEQAGAQAVIKCVDADGNITYQDSACSGGQAGHAVALPKAEARDDVVAWEAAAKDARVIAGMPKRWVLRARGAPLEIRAGTARDSATEVWRYGTRAGVTLVGFAGSNVAWQRDEGGPAAAAPAVSAEASTRGPQNRRFVIAGRYCDHVFTEIGAADRQEPLPVTGAGNRYVYEPQAGDPQMRTSFSCLGGKVADVERILVR